MRAIICTRTAGALVIAAGAILVSVAMSFLPEARVRAQDGGDQGE